MPGRYHSESDSGSRGFDDSRDFEAVEGGDEPSDEAMRQLRRLHAGGVTVVTSHDALGLHGLTVSAFCVVSTAPGRVLACLASGGDFLVGVEAAGTFAVSVLSDDQEFLADRFASRAPLVNPRFTGVKHRLTRQGNPVLEECLAWFDCAVESVEVHGDHAVVVGAVREGGFGTGVSPVIYFDGKYRFLEVE